MRIALAALGLLLLGACTTPVQQTARADDPQNLRRFTHPTDGAAFSQSDPRYYEQGNWVGGAGAVPRGSVPRP